MLANHHEPKWHAQSQYPSTKYCYRRPLESSQSHQGMFLVHVPLFVYNVYIVKQETKENQKTLEELRDRVGQLHRSILEPVYSQSKNTILPPALEANIEQFSKSVTLYNHFSYLSDMCY